MERCEKCGLVRATEKHIDEYFAGEGYSLCWLYFGDCSRNKVDLDNLDGESEDENQSKVVDLQEYKREKSRERLLRMLKRDGFY